MVILFAWLGEIKKLFDISSDKSYIFLKIPDKNKDKLILKQVCNYKEHYEI